MKIKVTILAAALGLACLQSAPAQTFKKVKVANNAPIVQVASGGASVWALGSNGHPYIFKGKSFALANTISLSQIAVGGGNAAQGDEVWGLNSSGGVFRASKSGTSWVFSQVSSIVLDLIQVGPGYQDSCHPYEVWGLNSSSQIFRYNFCMQTFAQEPGILCDIHVGGGDIWGADCGPDIFRFNFSSGSFDTINTPFSSFPALTVGPGGVVWGVNTGNSDIFRFDGDNRGWSNIGFGLAQIEAGGDGVWGLEANTSVVRWEPSGQNFVLVPGSLVSMSVGSGGGVWGVNSSHQVFAFSVP